YRGNQIRDRDHETCHSSREAHGLHDLRNPEPNSVKAAQYAAKGQAESDDTPIAQHRPECASFRHFFSGEPRCDKRFLRVAEPRRIGRTVGKEFEHHKGDQERRQAFAYKQPLPAVQAKGSVQSEYETGERAAYYEGQGHRGLKSGDVAREISLREPL